MWFRTNGNAWVAVDCLYQLLALMSDHPVGINLGSAFRIKGDHLETAEVRFADGKVLWANVINIQDVVLVEIIFANITSAVT